MKKDYLPILLPFMPRDTDHNAYQRRQPNEQVVLMAHGIVLDQPRDGSPN